MVWRLGVAGVRAVAWRAARRGRGAGGGGGGWGVWGSWVWVPDDGIVSRGGHGAEGGRPWGVGRGSGRWVRFAPRGLRWSELSAMRTFCSRDVGAAGGLGG